MKLLKYKDSDYYIPEELEKDFRGLIKKLGRLSLDSSYKEAYNGYSEVFRLNYDSYRVDIRVGQLFVGRIGIIRVIEVDEFCLRFRKVQKIFGIWISVGNVGYIGKETLLRDFMRYA